MKSIGNDRAGCNRFIGKVTKDVARQKRERAKIEDAFRANKARDQAAHFRRTYNAPHDNPFPAEINMRRFACLPKFDLLRNANGGLLSYAALALYPVFCVRANYEDENAWFQLSRENLAQLAGISTHTVDAGLDELEQATMPVRPGSADRRQLLQRQPGQCGRRRFYLYRASFVRLKTEGEDWRDHYFPFHGQLVDSGTWARLGRRAKALYLIARSQAYFHAELYELVERIDLYDVEQHGSFYRDYPARKWVVCNVPLARLFAMAGIGGSDATRVRDELEAAGLVEVIWLNDRDRVLKVYLRANALRGAFRQELRRERLEEAIG